MANPLQQAVGQMMSQCGSYCTELWLLTSTGLLSVLLLLAIAPILFAKVPQLERFGRFQRSLSGDALFLIFVVLAIVIIRIPGLVFPQQINPDESNIILAARTLLVDARFWVSVEVQAIGPLSIFAAAIPGMLGFSIDFTSIKVVGISIWCITALLMFFGFRHQYGADLAKIYTLPIACLAATFTFWDFIAFNGEHMAILAIALAYYLFSADRANAASQTWVIRWRAALFGAALVLMTMAKIQVGPIAVVWGAMAVLLSFRHDLSGAISYIVGALLAGVLLLVYLVGSGALPDFWQSYILNNLIYASVGWNASQQDTTLAQIIAAAPGYFFEPPETQLFLLVSLLGLLGGAVLWIANKRFRESADGEALLTWCVLVVTTIVCVLMPKNNWTHYLLLLFVPLNIALVCVIDGLRNLFNAGAPDTRDATVIAGNSKLAMLTVLFVALVPGWVSAELALVRGDLDGTRNASKHIQRGLHPSQDIQSVVQAIQKYVGPGEPVAHWGMDFTAIAMSGVSLGNREAQNERGLFPSYQQQYYLERWISDVVSRKPELVLDSSFRYADEYRLAQFPNVHRELLKHYKFVDNVKGLHFYTPK
jgi:hypothetical protein